MHPALARLPLEEKGYVLAALLARTPADAVRERLVGPAAQRCAEAVEVLAAEPKPARAAALAALIALLRAPIPAGVEKIHPDWLRERLDRETAPVIQAVVAELPEPVRRVAATLLAGRGQAAAPPLTREAGGVAALQRAVFAGFVPLSGPGAPSGAVARALLERELDDLPPAIDGRGAEIIGTSLRRAPGAVVARAAAALGGALAERVVKAAAKEGPPEAREAARTIVSSAAGGTPAEKVRDIGLRALAADLGDEGEGAALAVAQRLAPALGRRWLAVAGLSGLL